MKLIRFYKTNICIHISICINLYAWNEMTERGKEEGKIEYYHKLKLWMIGYDLSSFMLGLTFSV